MRLVVVAFVAALGCSKSAPEAADYDVVAATQQAVTAMCACHDKACADQVNADMLAKAADHQPRKLTQVDQDKLGELTLKLAECEKSATGK